LNQCFLQPPSPSSLYLYIYIFHPFFFFSDNLKLSDLQKKEEENYEAGERLEKVYGEGEQLLEKIRSAIRFASLEQGF